MISNLPLLPRSLPEPAYVGAEVLRRCFPDKKETIDSVVLYLEGNGSLKEHQNKFKPRSMRYSLTFARKSLTAHKYLSNHPELIPEGMGLTEFLNDYVVPFIGPMYVFLHEDIWER